MQLALLYVERVPPHGVVAEEPHVVEPGQRQGILGALEDLQVLKLLLGGPGVPAHPLHRDGGVVVGEGRRLELGVVKDEPGQPDAPLLARAEVVQPGVAFEVEKPHPAVVPGKVEVELNVKYRVDLVNVQDGDYVGRHVDPDPVLALPGRRGQVPVVGRVQLHLDAAHLVALVLAVGLAVAPQHDVDAQAVVARVLGAAARGQGEHRVGRAQLAPVVVGHPPEVVAHGQRGEGGRGDSRDVGIVGQGHRPLVPRRVEGDDGAPLSHIPDGPELCTFGIF